MLLAVLERRAGVSFGELDVFVQATAGVRLVEPGADLAIAAALLSSLKDRPVPADAFFLGEVGLGGEIRPAVGLERRLGAVADAVLRLLDDPAAASEMGERGRRRAMSRDWSRVVDEYLAIYQKVCR